MVAPIQKTIAEELFGSVNAFIAEAAYLQEDSLEIKRFLRQASQLMSINPTEANIAKAMIYQLCRNVDKVKDHVRIANQLPALNKTLVYVNSSISLSNLGIYSEAQNYFSLVTEPNEVEPYLIIDTAFGCLSLQKLRLLLTRAKEMNLHFSDKDIELTSRATEVMNKYKITDSDLAKYADVFGEVLRENNFMIKSRFPDVVVGDKTNSWYPETIFVIFKIDSDAKTAAKLYKESVRRLLAGFDDIPDAVHFSIEAY